jgi:exodeoxyribonuclease III
MRIATWNVNSLKVRISHVQDWLASQPVDVLGLQETKLTDDKFPEQALREIGYTSFYHGQKTYNGVALLVRSGHDVSQVQIGMPGLVDEQARVIAATVNSVRVACVYIPNGQALDSPKYQYKLAWLAALQVWIRNELSEHVRFALLGDYNIAPEDRDVHDPKAWEGQVLVSEPERVVFRELIGQGLTDTFRMFEQPEKTFSWWDYRMLGFRRNAGLRIDHILASRELAKHCTSCVIDRAPRKLEQPSDHTPVIAEFDFGQTQ